jgi:O-antigen/teichoic acid export membrane protein
MEAAADRKRGDVWPIIFIAASLILGAALGFVMGSDIAQSAASEIMRQQGKVGCGTFLVALPIGGAIFGAMAGAITSIAVVLLIRFYSKPRGPRRQSDWAAYYGK